METQVDATQDAGLSAPVTPPVISGQLPPTPRQQCSTRTHETEVVDDHESKRAKIESQKKQKINQLREYNESMIRTVKVGTDEFATMDEYEHELDINDSTALLTLSFGTMRTSLSSKMFQMLCGHQLLWKSSHHLQNNGWTNWLMRSRFNDCFQWVFSRERRSVWMRFQVL